MTGVLRILLIVVLFAASTTAFARNTDRDAQLQISAAVYAAAATQAAIQRRADERTRALQAEIDALASEVAAGEAERERLVQAHEALISDLAERDREYAVEIAVFRGALETIVETEEGLAALARFNAGDEIGALDVLDDLAEARASAREAAARTAEAEDRRPTANLALDAQRRGRVPLNSVIERFQRIVALDPGGLREWRILAVLQIEADDLEGAIASVRTALERAEGSTEEPGLLEQLGEALVLNGDTVGALEVFQRRLAIERAALAADPDHPPNRRTVSVALHDLGQAYGDLADYTAALEAYREARAINRALVDALPVEGDPAAAERWAYTVMRSLTVSLNRMGETHRLLGDLPAALSAFREAHEIRVTLRELEPESIEALRDIGVSYDRIGDILVEQGDTAAALEARLASLAISEQLIEIDPESALHLRGASVDLHKVGHILRGRNDLDGAMAHYQRAFEIRSGLAEKNPGSGRAQRDLTVSLNNLGDLHMIRAEPAEALARYQAGLGVRRALAADYPDSMQFKRDLVVSLDNVGEAELALGDHQAARAAQTEALELAELIYDAAPDSAQAARDVAQALVRLGAIETEAGDPAAALDLLVRARSIYDGLLSDDPSSVLVLGAIATTDQARGAALAASGAPQEARASPDLIAALRARLSAAPVTLAYVGAEAGEDALRIALGLRERALTETLFDAPVFLPVRKGSGLPAHEGGAAFAAGVPVLACASWSEVIAASGMLDRTPDGLARDHHEAYRIQDGDGPAAAPWEALAERFRQSNRRAVAHLPAKLASLGFDVTPLTGEAGLSPESRPSLAPEETLYRNATELMEIARLEHLRWAADRLVDGWRFGEVRDDAARTHPNLVDFDSLPAEIQAYDIRLAALLSRWVRPGEGGLRRVTGRRAAPEEIAADRAAVEAAGIDLGELA
ncbi:MAG: tetratricopeptide repeat protein [Oceanicaulis sp.]